ncbi:related to SEM1 Regulator of exocytosis and pseudohyphal differentiation [Ramularia collo-cygni]|uniref:26S proteasome complex subunit SEM1 n=1 Tax=Ramularia collo-cygni TaxID=112498 RepID=A0A2D3VH20_9PEZI|nr:related to SEM1 Regulator of exocytosis and pseudohyphal differentiation [Ramularia collo-cygni]CZT24572.1 related to SEM1 Regulator of exocytosis and pseudohyphal differentiation [Ramularia collo-cygni]
MSGAADASSTKATASDNKDNSQQPQKPAAQLEEDDEFEDFPVEDWAKEEEVGSQTANTHLWEESWDDDDTTDEFSVQLKEELKKMESARK